MLFRDASGIVIATYEKYVVTKKKREHIRSSTPEGMVPISHQSDISFELEEAPPNTTVFHAERHLFPPMLLHPMAWIRYGYSKRDILKIYEGSPASEVWQLSFILSPKSMQLESSVCGVKPRLNDVFTFNYVARKTVFLNMLPHQSAFTETSETDVLCDEGLPQGVYLPVSQTDQKSWTQLRHRVADMSYDPNVIPVYTQIPMFVIKDAQYLPVQLVNEKYVKLCRVIESSIYSSIVCSPLYTPVNQPRQFEHSGTLYVFTEECVFVSVTKVNKKRKRGIT